MSSAKQQNQIGHKWICSQIQILRANVQDQHTDHLAEARNQELLSELQAEKSKNQELLLALDEQQQQRQQLVLALDQQKAMNQELHQALEQTRITSDVKSNYLDEKEHWILVYKQECEQKLEALAEREQTLVQQIKTGQDQLFEQERCFGAKESEFVQRINQLVLESKYKGESLESLESQIEVLQDRLSSLANDYNDKLTTIASLEYQCQHMDELSHALESSKTRELETHQLIQGFCTQMAAVDASVQEYDRTLVSLEQKWPQLQQYSRESNQTVKTLSMLVEELKQQVQLLKSENARLKQVQISPEQMEQKEAQISQLQHMIIVLQTQLNEAAVQQQTKDQMLLDVQGTLQETETMLNDQKIVLVQREQEQQMLVHQLQEAHQSLENLNVQSNALGKEKQQWLQEREQKQIEMLDLHQSLERNQATLKQVESSKQQLADQIQVLQSRTEFLAQELDDIQKMTIEQIQQLQQEHEQMIQQSNAVNEALEKENAQYQEKTLGYEGMLEEMHATVKKRDAEVQSLMMSMLLSTTDLVKTESLNLGLKEQIAASKQEIQQLQHRLESQQESAPVVQELQESLASVKQELADKQQLHESVQSQLKQAKEVAQEELVSVKASFASAQEALVVANQQIQDISNQLLNVQQLQSTQSEELAKVLAQQESTNNVIVEINQKVVEKEQLIAQQTMEMETLLNKEQEMQRLIESLQTDASSGRIETLEQELQEAIAALKQVQEEHADLVQEQQGIIEEKQSLERKVQGLEERQQKLANVRELFVGYKQEVKETKEMCQQQIKRFSDLLAAFEAKSQELKPLKVSKIIERTKSLNVDLEKTKQELDLVKNQLTNKTTMLDKAIKDNTELIRSNSEITKQHLDARKTAANLVGEVASLKNKLAKTLTGVTPDGSPVVFERKESKLGTKRAQSRLHTIDESPDVSQGTFFDHRI
ncbi:hypothetical protein EDD86DRAFT_264119 [Gorgonomyces haynaldii]|nr:hypothetical protein EDD86DRAFT_264119 [Gorgonomyces haynaldii]